MRTSSESFVVPKYHKKLFWCSGRAFPTHLHDEEHWVNWIPRLGLCERAKQVHGDSSCQCTKSALWPSQRNSYHWPTRWRKAFPAEQWSILFPSYKNLYPLMEQPLDERHVSSYTWIRSPSVSPSFVKSIRGTGRSNLLRSSRMAVVGNSVARAEGQPSLA